MLDTRRNEIRFKCRDRKFWRYAVLLLGSSISPVGSFNVERLSIHFVALYLRPSSISVADMHSLTGGLHFGLLWLILDLVPY